MNDAGSVLLRADARSELVRAVSGALVAFEAGEVGEADGSDWSVTVLGHADATEDSPGDEPGCRASVPTGSQLPGQVSTRIRPEPLTGRLLTGGLLSTAGAPPGPPDRTKARTSTPTPRP